MPRIILELRNYEYGFSVGGMAGFRESVLMALEHLGRVRILEEHEEQPEQDKMVDYGYDLESDKRDIEKELREQELQRRAAAKEGGKAAVKKSGASGNGRSAYKPVSRLPY